MQGNPHDPNNLGDYKSKDSDPDIGKDLDKGDGVCTSFYDCVPDCSDPEWGCSPDISWTLEDWPAMTVAFAIPCLATGLCETIAVASSTAYEMGFWKTVAACLGNAFCRMVAGITGGAGIGGNNPLEDIKYTDKVLAQATQTDYHGFPEVVDAFGSDGVVTTITGGDGITRTLVQIQGAYKGVEGVFEYIIELDGYCNHRLFVPKDLGGGC